MYSYRGVYLKGVAILLGLLTEVGDQVVAVLLLLETGEGHLGTRDVLLGILEVLEKSLLIPGYTLVDVGLGVREALDGTGLTAEETVKVGADWECARAKKRKALSVKLFKRSTEPSEQSRAAMGVPRSPCHINLLPKIVVYLQQRYSSQHAAELERYGDVRLLTPSAASNSK